MRKILIYICVVLFLFMVGCNNPTPEVPGGNIGGGEENKGDEENNNNDETIKEDKYDIIHSTLLLLDLEKEYIELLNTSATKLSKETKVYKLVGEEKKEATFDDLYCGMNNIFVKTKNDLEVLEILIDNEPIFNRMRVAIRNSIANISDINTLYHDSVTIYFQSDTIIKTYDGKESINVKAKQTLNFFVKDNQIVF